MIIYILYFNNICICNIYNSITLLLTCSDYLRDTQHQHLYLVFENIFNIILYLFPVAIGKFDDTKRGSKRHNKKFAKVFKRKPMHLKINKYLIHIHILLLKTVRRR